MFERILAILLPVALVTLAGFLRGRACDDDFDAANALNMQVCVPALVLHALANPEVTLGSHLVLIQAACACLLLAGLCAWPLAALTGVPGRALVPTSMFNNTGNLGLPVALLAWGEAALAPALLLLVAEMSLHVLLAPWLLGGREARGAPFGTTVMGATAVGLALQATDHGLPAPIAVALDMLGQMAVPLMLLALGVRLGRTHIRHWRAGLIGALVRPLSGLAALSLVLPWVELDAMERGLLIVFAVLPPAMMNFLFAERYGRHPEEVAAIVLIGNLAALATLPPALAFALAPS